MEVRKQKVLLRFNDREDLSPLNEDGSDAHRAEARALIASIDEFLSDLGAPTPDEFTKILGLEAAQNQILRTPAGERTGREILSVTLPPNNAASGDN